MEIVLVDDHRLFTIGLREIINKSRTSRVKGEYSNGRTFLQNYTPDDNDLVLIDLDLEEENGLEIIIELRQKFPKAKVAIMSMYKEPGLIKKAVTLGIAGYFNKDIDQEELMFGLKKIEGGGKYYTSAITEILLQKVKDDPAEKALELTERERQVLQFIIDGYTSEEIASAMKLSKRTVDTHRSSILSKFGLKNTAQLIKFTVENKLL